jgi:hypothetical protein
LIDIEKKSCACDGGHTVRICALGILRWRNVSRRLPAKPKEKAMLDLLTFMVVAVALGMPLLVAQVWGPIEMA